MFVLFGPPGVGKNTLGSHLAKNLGIATSDIDHLIEKAVGMSCAAFVEQHGEFAFRALEELIVEDLLPGIIICGGGTILNPKNRGALEALGTLVYLTCPRLLLLERAFSKPRALYKTTSDYEKLLEKRLPQYESIEAKRVDTSTPIEKQMECIYG